MSSSYSDRLAKQKQLEEACSYDGDLKRVRELLSDNQQFDELAKSLNQDVYQPREQQDDLRAFSPDDDSSRILQLLKDQDLKASEVAQQRQNLFIADPQKQKELLAVCKTNDDTAVSPIRSLLIINADQQIDAHFAEKEAESKSIIEALQRSGAIN